MNDELKRSIMHFSVPILWPLRPFGVDVKTCFCVIVAPLLDHVRSIPHRVASDRLWADLNWGHAAITLMKILTNPISDWAQLNAVSFFVVSANAGGSGHSVIVPRHETFGTVRIDALDVHARIREHLQQLFRVLTHLLIGIGER